MLQFCLLIVNSPELVWLRVIGHPMLGSMFNQERCPGVATAPRGTERLNSLSRQLQWSFHHVPGNAATGMLQQVALSYPIGISWGCLRVQTCHWTKPCHWGSKPTILKNPSLDRGLGCSLRTTLLPLASPRGWHLDKRHWKSMAWGSGISFPVHRHPATLSWRKEYQTWPRLRESQVAGFLFPGMGCPRLKPHTR